jgi:hypothetical protein
MTERLLKKECCKIIGLWMEVHRELAPPAFRELFTRTHWNEFQKPAFSTRERDYKISHKKIVLKRRFYADFII